MEPIFHSIRKGNESGRRWEFINCGVTLRKEVKNPIINLNPQRKVYR